MKKIIYSNYLKVIAVILFLVCIALGTYVLTDGYVTLLDEEIIVFELENSFDKTGYFTSMIYESEECVYSAFVEFYHSKSKNGYNEYNGTDSDVTVYVSPQSTLQSVTAVPLENVGMLTKDGLTFTEYLDRKLKNMYSNENAVYFVKVGETVLTNEENVSEDTINNSRFFRIVSLRKNGNIHEETSVNNYYPGVIYNLNNFIASTYTEDIEEITIGTAIREDYVNKIQEIWERQADLVRVTFLKTLSYYLGALFILIYLICVAGKTHNGEYVPMWIDRLFTEIHIAVFIGIPVLVIALCIEIVGNYQYSEIAHYMMRALITFIFTAGSSLTVTPLLSLTRKLKTRTFLETSIIFILLRFIFKIIKSIFRWTAKRFTQLKTALSVFLSKKTGVILSLILVVYTSLIGLLGVFLPKGPIFLFLGIIVYLLGVFFIAYRCRDLDEIKKGADKIRNGELQYKIDGVKSDDMKKLADNINEIGNGLEKSVSEKLRAERLKTDLITNVSHDLKTPLTSIINYTELLSGVESLPDEARDYLDIIAKKSEKLKNLTQDLFEISKVQSGNEKLVFERIDVSLIIEQALGELDSEIIKSGLTFCVKTDKELFIRADGRKLSRVLSNLINNTLKYSFPASRVFVSAFERGGNAVIEIKNTSSYIMEFDPEEITGRFVRADESRSDGGNGLGLAIAKGYTEACNGKFDIVIDGDLFKAVMTFKLSE